jgi:hypothetical protein
MSSYPIYQGLWESIDAVLFNKGLSLAKDIAAELGVPPQALIEQLKKEQTGKFTLIPDTDDTANLYQCNALLHRGSVYMRCRCPTLGPTKLCTTHSEINLTSVDLPGMQRLVTSDSVYLLDSINRSTVYTLNGDPCGVLKGSKLTLFEISND